MKSDSQNGAVEPVNKDALYRRTLEMQRRLNERAPAFHSAMRQAGFTYESRTASFRRGDVRVYLSQARPDIQWHSDMLKPYQRFTIKTPHTAAVDIDDALDVPQATVIEKVLSVVEQAVAAERRVTSS
jgi:hypothetical protein